MTTPTYDSPLLRHVAAGINPAPGTTLSRVTFSYSNGAEISLAGEVATQWFVAYLGVIGVYERLRLLEAATQGRPAFTSEAFAESLKNKDQ